MDSNGTGVPRFVLVVDLGSTNIRCHVYNDKAEVIAECYDKVVLSYPSPDAVELEFENLWTMFTSIVRRTLNVANLKASDVTCMGITTFRGSFITWDKETGDPFHNINMWQDKRTKRIVKQWNDSLLLKLLKAGSGALHLLTGLQKFKAGYALKFLTVSIPLRLKWAIEGIPKLKARIKEKQVMFGTVDTWLLWKLTSGKVWATDHSSASSTLLYDPYQCIWSPIILNLLKIPDHILPNITDTCGALGFCDEYIFGAEIPITGMIADQQSSTFGHCAFDQGDIKLTIGTGSFIDVNTGDKPIASITGIYPLVGWKFHNTTTYLAEASNINAGTCIEWLHSSGVLRDIGNSSELAYSVPDTNGCYFVPALTGLPAPINDDRATGMLIGITPSVSSAHITRAVLESLAFLIQLQYKTVLTDYGRPVNNIRVDGGVANNDFLLQTISNLIGKEICRPSCLNMTSRGAAYMAGLGAGVWKSLDDLKMLHLDSKVFKPVEKTDHYGETKANWERAVNRAKLWLQDT